MTQARAVAIERIQARRHFRDQFMRFAAVNGFFIFLWAVNGGGFFWPGIILVGWGLHLAFCLIRMSARPISEDEITREMQRWAVNEGGAR